MLPPSMDIQAIVSKQLRERRDRLGLTQARLAEKANVSVELVSRIERGRCLPSIPTLIAFSKVLETTPNRLLGFEEKADAEVDALMETMSILSAPRVREIRRIAEALATYERRGAEE